MEYSIAITIAATAIIAISGLILYYRDKIRLLENKSKESEQILLSQIQSLENLRKDAETTDQLKSQFLANMSHELRTPMHSILSFSKISLKKIGIIDSMQLIKYIETIHTSGSKLLNIINEILDISKLESGSTIFEFEDSNFEDLVNESIKVCQSYLLDKFINFEFSNNSAFQNVCMDEMRITQVTQNLLANAIKFTPSQGDIKITLYDSKINNEDAITFQIDDNGPGIPKDELHSIFDKFIQSSITASGAGGTGLGLCICKELIEAHRGNIEAQNNNYGGATFIFTIPIKQENKELEVIKKI